MRYGSALRSILTLALATHAVAAGAGERPQGGADASLIGTRVRITWRAADAARMRPDGAPGSTRGKRSQQQAVAGTLVAEDGLLLRVARRGSDEVVVVPRAIVVRVQVSRGQQSMWHRGAKIGAIAGAALGLTLAGLCLADQACSDDLMQAALFAPVSFGAFGGALGAVTGAPFRGDRWEDAPPGRTAVRLMPVPGGVGLSVTVRPPRRSR